MPNDYKVVGPHAQTIFLGASVTEANMTLAWGSESSTCEVKLVNDYQPHQLSAAFDGLNTAIDTIHSTIDNNNPSSAIAANARSQQYLKPIINFEKKKKDYNTSVDAGPGLPITVRDIGKKCWDPHDLNTLSAPRHWLGPDPGFLGNSYSIMGCPCKFRFEDLTFCGIINKWTYDNGIFSVSIVGPGSILKGCKLIVNDYYGTISTMMPFNNDNGNPIAIPYSNPDRPGSFAGEVAHGNIPNLFNIFGWLQNQYMGFAKITENGISAAQIYEVLTVLLGGGTWDDFVDSNGNAILINSNGITTNKFSPFGGIIGKSPLGIISGQEVLLNTKGFYIGSSMGDAMDPTMFGLLKTQLAVDGLYRSIFRLDLSNVPKPDPYILLPLSSSIALDEFIDFCCKGAGYDWNCELVADNSESPYTATIVIKTYARNVQYQPRVLKNFITNFGAADNVLSYDLGEEFKEQNVRKVVIGGLQERIAQFLCNTTSKYNGSTFHQGSRSFTPVESWILTANLENGSPHNIYREPLADVQRLWDSSSSTYKMINGAITAQTTSTEPLSLYNTGMNNAALIVGSYYTRRPDLANIADPFRDFITSAPGLVGAGTAAYPVHLDIISPYFGVGSDGYPRRVFYDRRLKQHKINIPMGDITAIIPLPGFNPLYNATSDGSDMSAMAGGGYLTIWENEIRAALSDCWFTYIASLANVNVWTPTARLIAAYAGPANVVTANQLLAANGIIPFSNKLSWQINNGGWGIFSNSTYYTRAMGPVLESLNSFIKEELGQYYGKSYLVRVPNVRRSVGFDGKNRYDYEITESGWEEPGNMLDDTILIGSTTADLLSEENGKFGPVLGWHSSAEAASVRNVVYNTQGAFSNFSAKSVANNENHYYTLIADGDSVVVAYKPIEYKNLITNQPSFADAFNNNIPITKLFKTYKKASMGTIGSSKVFFDNYLKLQYALINSPTMVATNINGDLATAMVADYFAATRIGQETPSYSSVPNLRYQQIQFLDYVSDPLDPGNLLQYIWLMGGTTDSWWALGPAPKLPMIGTAGRTAGDVPPSMPYARYFYPRAVTPCFAAVPVRYNKYTYGPWSTSPGEIASIIFPNVNNNAAWTNNIVGGVDLEINPQYVPWEYGGMDALDTAILTALGDNSEYQQIEETGRITLAGVLLNNVSIGQRITYGGELGPLCNSVSLTVGNDGTKTTYFFRTFSRKLGYFNKENADNIKNVSRKNLELKRDLIRQLKG